MCMQLVAQCWFADVNLEVPREVSPVGLVISEKQTAESAEPTATSSVEAGDVNEVHT